MSTVGDTPEQTSICTDGERLCRLIVKHGFREGVIRMAHQLQGASPSDYPVAAFSYLQRREVERLITDQLAKLKIAPAP